MKKWMIVLVTALVLFCSCKNQFVKDSAFRRSGSNSEKADNKKNISLVCWNVQTFFDAVTTGTEYKEYTNSARWNKEKYVKRLEKLCDVMTSLNPDIFVMEEIENEAVVQDIANVLAGGAWDNKKNWRYVCFAKESGSAIGCAVFSRYELESLRTHSIDIRTQAEDQPLMRPLMQVSVNTGNQIIELFVNHWKSKSGGEEETEIWRDWQELLLGERAGNVIRDENIEEHLIIMCGDFNRSAEDFILQTSNQEKTNTILRGYTENLEAYSLWFRSDGALATETGSYYYDGVWERIDNILISGNVKILYFTAVSEAPLADEEGFPLPYKVYTGEGCSDHLPLKCILTI